MEDRRHRAPGQSVERPIPQRPQLLQTLQGVPGALRTALTQAKAGLITVGMPILLLVFGPLPMGLPPLMILHKIQ